MTLYFSAELFVLDLNFYSVKEMLINEGEISSNGSYSECIYEWYVHNIIFILKMVTRKDIS